MDTGWTVFVVVLGISIIGLTMWGIVVRVLPREDIGVTAPTTVEDTLEAEQRKREFLGYNTILKDASNYNERDDHFVKCIDMGPVATDPIPDEIWKNIKEEK